MFCGLCFKPPRFHFITLLLLPQQLFPQVVTNLLPFGGGVVIHHVKQLLNTWRRVFHSWRFLLTPPSFTFTLLPQLLPPRTSLRRGGLIQRCRSRNAYGSDMLELWWERSCGGFCGQADADVGVARTLLPLTLVQLLRALHMLKL